MNLRRSAGLAIAALALGGALSAATLDAAPKAAQRLPGTIAFSGGTEASGFDVFLARPGRAVAQLTHGELPRSNPPGPSWSPDGSQLLVGVSYPQGYYLVPTNGRSAVRLTGVNGPAAWLPDSKKIAFSNGGPIYVAAADNLGNRQVLARGASAWSLSPDGTRIAFVGRDARGCTALFLVNTDGAAKVRQVRPRPAIAKCTRHSAYWGLAWSPDGSQLAVECCSNWWNLNSLYLMRLDGTGVRRVHRGVIAITWSPDGRRIAVATGVIQWSYSVMNANGTGVRPVCRFCSITWFPDGSKIAYLGDRHQGRISVVNADGSGRRVVARTHSKHTEFALSPDGSAFAYTAGTGSDFNRSLYVVNADGSGRRLVAHSSTIRYWAPSWRPLSN